VLLRFSKEDALWRRAALIGDRVTSVVNFRCHADLTVNFAPGFNVIVGVNGSGKTSLLMGICELFFTYGFLATREGLQKFDESNVRLCAKLIGELTRFELMYPVSLRASGFIFNEPIEWHRSINAAGMKVNESDSPSRNLDVMLEAMRSGGNQNRRIFPTPVTLFYRANRHWQQFETDPIKSVTNRDSSKDSFKSWGDASLDAAALQSWVVAKYFERLQSATELGRAVDAIVDDELALVNSSLNHAIAEVRGLRYDMKKRSLLVDWHPKENTLIEPTPFENLSDGQRAVICLIADIARRMCLLNPQLGDQVTLQTPGVVLIDELDMHLHPKWQRMITTGLKAAFPAVQFIVTSHSPQVLGELQPGEIILLNAEGASQPQVSYGLDSSAVLAQIMEAPARTPAVEEKISALFAVLEENNLDFAREQLSELRKLAPGIPELAGAQALLKRKEILGR
jgi:predicted ATP-binding protein involved in virulence